MVRRPRFPFGGLPFMPRPALDLFMPPSPFSGYSGGYGGYSGSPLVGAFRGVLVRRREREKERRNEGLVEGRGFTKDVSLEIVNGEEKLPRL